MVFNPLGGLLPKSGCAKMTLWHFLQDLTDPPSGEVGAVFAPEQAEAGGLLPKVVFYSLHQDKVVGAVTQVQPQLLAVRY